MSSKCAHGRCVGHDPEWGGDVFEIKPIVGWRKVFMIIACLALPPRCCDQQTEVVRILRKRECQICAAHEMEVYLSVATRCACCGEMKYHLTPHIEQFERGMTAT